MLFRSDPTYVPDPTDDAAATGGRNLDRADVVFASNLAGEMARSAPRGTIGEADGGQGGTLMDAVIAIETVASVCPRSADVVQAGNFGAIRVLAEYGTPLQKERYLRRLLAGDGVISVGMSEPEAGSAVTDLETSAPSFGLSKDSTRRSLRLAGTVQLG